MLNGYFSFKHSSKDISDTDMLDAAMRLNESTGLTLPEAMSQVIDAVGLLARRPK